MKAKYSYNFLIGLFVGGLVALLIWYWHKSTSAEDGALALLDRLAAADKRIRQLTAELTTRTPAQAPATAVPDMPRTSGDVPPFLSGEAAQSSDDLTQVKGIGPVFATRLKQAGINSIAGLQAMTAASLATILQVSEGRAETILAAAGKK